MASSAAAARSSPSAERSDATSSSVVPAAANSCSRVEAPAQAVARGGGLGTVGEALEEGRVAPARVGRAVGRREPLGELEQRGAGELVAGLPREQTLEVVDRRRTVLDPRQLEQRALGELTLAEAVEVGAPALHRAGRVAALGLGAAAHVERLLRLGAVAVVAQQEREALRRAGVVPAQEPAPADTRERAGAGRRIRVRGVGLAEGGLGRVVLILGEETLGEGHARLRRVGAVGLGAQQVAGDLDRLRRASSVEARDRGGVARVARPGAAVGLGGLVLATEREQEVAARGGDPVAELAVGTGRRRAAEDLERVLAPAQLLQGLRAPVVELRPAPGAGVLEGLQGTACVVGLEQVDAAVQRRLGSEAAPAVALEQPAERGRRAGVVLERGVREPLAAQGGVLELAGAARQCLAVGHRRLARAAGLEVGLAEQETQLGRLLGVAVALEEVADALHRAVEVAQLERAPGAAVARTLCVLTLRLGGEHGVVALGGEVEALELELRLAGEERRRGDQVVGARGEHRLERARRVLGAALLESALPEAQLALRGVLEAGAPREALEVRGRFAGPAQLEQGGGEAVAGEVGLRVARVVLEERRGLLRDHVVVALLVEPRDELVLVVAGVRREAGSRRRIGDRFERRGGGCERAEDREGEEREGEAAEHGDPAYGPED